MHQLYVLWVFFYILFLQKLKIFLRVDHENRRNNSWRKSQIWTEFHHSFKGYPLRVGYTIFVLALVVSIYCNNQYCIPVNMPLKYKSLGFFFLPFIKNKDSIYANKLLRGDKKNKLKKITKLIKQNNNKKHITNYVFLFHEYKVLSQLLQRFFAYFLRCLDLYM